MIKSAATFSLYDIVLCLSNAVDLIDPKLNYHHQRVAYMAYRLAEQLRLPPEECRRLLMQGLLHDIGSLTLQERLDMHEREMPSIHSHAFRSARLLSQCKTLRPLAEAVRYHHIPWNHGAGDRVNGHPVPPAAHLLHLADRVCVMTSTGGNILARADEIMQQIHRDEDTVFEPSLVRALEAVSVKEYIWLELTGVDPLRHLPDAARNFSSVDLDGALDISRIFSHVIDFRSHFTATHSAGVAKTAERLAQLACLSENECEMMLIAGYLHDLGKLAIRDTVLEKSGKLNMQEFSAIRSHTFHTYQLLRTIHGFETINQWASFHHERLNGTGYPFHLSAPDIPFGSRIMAVADVFTAVAENRPYRPGMKREEILGVLRGMVNSGALCPHVTGLLSSHIDEMMALCAATQQQAAAMYEEFFTADEEEPFPVPV